MSLIGDKSSVSTDINVINLTLELEVIAKTEVFFLPFVHID
jgi:hypothetical protein